MANAKTTTTLPRLKMPDLVKVFGVSHITIINWKNPKEGVEHRKTPLPHYKDSRGFVTYNAAAVKRWAEKNEVPMKKDPVAIAEKLAAKQEGAAKPGPKPKATPRKAPARAAKAGPKKLLRAPTKKRAKPIKKALLEASAKVSGADSHGIDVEVKRTARKAKDTAPAPSTEGKPEGKALRVRAPRATRSHAAAAGV